LNGDIDNYRDLALRLASGGWQAPADITTDTKVIAMLIGHLVTQGASIEEAFRLAVNQFQGSHAIAMHTDMAPGKLFLAQRGSGQAIFVGMGPDHFMAASEVYGFVEQTGVYIKVDGESVLEGKQGRVQGQIFILDQALAGSLDGIQAMTYDGTSLELGKADLKQTPITSRDIDRQDFPHYFLKEISESPKSVARTLHNRWKYKAGTRDVYSVVLDDRAIPQKLRTALTDRKIRRIFFLGQGTAGVAAQACADILRYYMEDASLQISALKASEMSGFQMGNPQSVQHLSDALIVAISQSGTTTDTNRTVDMVREQGAYTLAIVNRRDSDLTFKVDGVLYTSSGRDIEMSVASTKALYAQIVAGALLGLFLAQLGGRRDERFVSAEVGRLLALPNRMQEVLATQDRIAQSARRLAPSKLYWAAVGSGPNKASADEIRIKLSELCYKTISSDFVEDKKHIDLSSEPLIIVCAAGTRPTVIGDIVKDTAIFKAHKATPVVIADQGEDRFAPNAEDVFHVPPVSEHLAPIINTLVGHLWGYYAALAINEGSTLLYDFRKRLMTHIESATDEGLSIYEIVLEKRFQEMVTRFYLDLRRQIFEGRFAATIVPTTELILLLKYLSGRLPVADFEMDFGKKGTARNIMETFYDYIGRAIKDLSRPVDAIKHQAKTVTVGTTRMAVEAEQGILFEMMAHSKFRVDHLTPQNMVVIKNIQPIIADIRGAILYRIDGLNILGQPEDDTRITIIKKTGDLAPLSSRVETDNRLQGTKRIIVRQGNVFIGKGRKDDRRLVVIPLIAESGQPTPVISHLLLMHIGFKESVAVDIKRKALGGKYEHIKNIVQENNVTWDEALLDSLPMEDLFGFSAEKVGEAIVGLISAKSRSAQNR
jgi:glucosamine--fructose-6-phosphate aminotransferase (isomerizing)